MYLEEQVVHGDGGAPAASGGDQARRPDSPRGADAGSLQAPAFTDAGCSRWSTPWRSSSRVPPASASTPLPTPCTPLSLHTRSKPTMANVEVDPEMAVGAQPKKRTFFKFSYRGVVLDVLLDISMDDLV